MADVFTKEKRSEIMSRIRGKNTVLETIGLEVLRRTGIRFRKHPKGIYGNPDAANKKLKVAVFFDSDFWHGYKYYVGFHKKLPNSYWHDKIRKNINRDIKVNSNLLENNWRVIRFWEHDLKNEEKCIEIFNKVFYGQL